MRGLREGGRSGRAEPVNNFEKLTVNIGPPPTS
jgi:hypothetical protein